MRSDCRGRVFDSPQCFCSVTTVVLTAEILYTEMETNIRSSDPTQLIFTVSSLKLFKVTWKRSNWPQVSAGNSRDKQRQLLILSGLPLTEVFHLLEHFHWVFIGVSKLSYGLQDAVLEELYSTGQLFQTRNLSASRSTHGTHYCCLSL